MKSNHISGEKYEILWKAKSLKLSEGWIYTVTEGYKMSYYENTRFLSYPFI